MIVKNINFKNYIAKRPIAILANSSFYLTHYRLLLLKKLKDSDNYIISIAPSDSSSSFLSNHSLYIPWRIKRRKEFNLMTSTISFVRLLVIIRSIKPKLVHSHTLKANLMTSIICFLLGIPCVLSFTGLGKLSNYNKIYKLLFKITIKVIYFFSTNNLTKYLKVKSSKKRTAFIFQNPRDLENFYSKGKNFDKQFSNLIYGSGLPKIYFDQKSSKKRAKRWIVNKEQKDIPDLSTFELIYCGRLINSKGIKIFLELSKYFPNKKFTIFGRIDESSKDSISKKDISKFNIQKNINFKGQIKDPLLNLNSKYPILIIPSMYGEGLPRTILEAISMRIPVISSYTASCDLFKKDTIYIAEDNNAYTYYKLVKQILNDFKKEELEKKLKKGSKLIKSFSEEVIVDKTLNLYSNILEESDIEKLSYLNKKDFSSWLPS